MNTTMTGKDFIDALAADLTALFSSAMERIWGPGADARRLAYCWLYCIAKNAHDYNGVITDLDELKPPPE